jgi:hypothetical protein
MGDWSRVGLSFPGFLRTRQVLETKTFTEQLQKLGDIKRIDEALGSVQLALTENAEVFPLVRGYQRIRLAKTNEVGQVPPLNIWYMIDPDDDFVLLLYVEVATEG